MGFDSVPTIDFRHLVTGSDAQRRTAVRTLGDALCQFGFFTLDHHSVSAELIREAYDAFQAFFGLPEDIKRQYAGIDGGQRGFTPVGVEHAKDSPHPDLKEFWHVGQELPAGHPLRQVYPDNVWPTERPQMRGAALALYRDLERLADAVLEALAEYFELPRRRFADMIKDGNSILRAIHYPPVPPDVDPQRVRAAAHEDINLITLLCEATDSGLELLTHDGQWRPIHALAGQIVVDSGDMLKRCTNGVVPATTHRVVNPDASRGSRYSMPFFAHPYPSCDLTVMDRFVTGDRPAQWPPITAMEFLQERLREIGLAK